MQSKRALGGLLLFCALLLTFSSPSAAQDGANRFATVNLSLLRSTSGANLVPVEVTVATQRAVEATLVIESQHNAIDWEFPLALAANTDVSQVFLAPLTFADLNLHATLVVEGETVAEDNLRGFDVRANENVVGLIELAAPAGSIPLTPTIGQATLIELNDFDVLPGLDSVVTSPGGFRTLTPDEREVLMSWTAAGRQLLVAGEPGSIDELLPSEWQSSGRTMLAGAGIIRYTGNDWAGNLAPGTRSTIDPNMLAQINQGGFNIGRGSNQELLSDAGFGVPGLGVLSLVLVTYLLVAGPITFGVLKSMDRQTLAWIALPALAVLFTGGVFVAGGFLTSGRGNGYATIVEVSPAGATATETILIAKDGRQTVDLAVGSTLLSTTLAANGRVGSPVVVQPTRTSTKLLFDIDPGSGGTAVLSGLSEIDADAVEIVDVVVTADDVSGRFVNSSGSDLHHVVGLIGESIVNIGEVADGQSVDFELNFVVAPNRSPELRVWNVENWLNWNGANLDNAELTDGPINASAWMDWRARRVGTATPRGTLTIIGWTRDTKSSLVGGTGRTAFVVRDNLVDAEGSTIHPHVVRAVPATSVNPFDERQDGPPSIVTQLVRPAGSDTSELALEVTAEISEVEVWTSEGWRSLALDEPNRQTVALVDEAWIDDVMWVRQSLGNNFFDGPSVREARLVEARADTLVVELLPVGERSQRASLRGDFGEDFPVTEPFEEPAQLGLSSGVMVDDDGHLVVESELNNTYDEWLVELEEGQNLTVTMAAVEGSFDPNLIVRGVGGQVVAQNDDFDGLNSRVDFIAAESGTYVVEARPLSQPAVGIYELTFQIEPFERLPEPETTTTTLEDA